MWRQLQSSKEFIPMAVEEVTSIIINKKVSLVFAVEIVYQVMWELPKSSKDMGYSFSK